MDEKNSIYNLLIQMLKDRYGSQLKMAVLFGSQARQEATPDSDHDIFLLIDDLPTDPLARQRDVRSVLLPILYHLPGSISFVAKTSQEVNRNLTPLLLDIFVDGVPLYGKAKFHTYQQKVISALRQSGLQRQRVADTWMWFFPHNPGGNWILDWEGYHAN